MLDAGGCVNAMCDGAFPLLWVIDCTQYTGRHHKCKMLMALPWLDLAATVEGRTAEQYAAPTVAWQV